MTIIAVFRHYGLNLRIYASAEGARKKIGYFARKQHDVILSNSKAVGQLNQVDPLRAPTHTRLKRPHVFARQLTLLQTLWIISLIQRADNKPVIQASTHDGNRASVMS